MTNQQIITQARYQLNEKTPAFFEDVELYLYATDGVRDLAQRLPKAFLMSLHTYSYLTATGAYIAGFVDESDSFLLPNDFTKEIDVSSIIPVDGKFHIYRPISEKSLWSYQYLSYFSVSDTNPKYVLGEDRSIKVLPKALVYSGERKIMLKYIKTPDEISSSTLGSACQIEHQAQHLVVKYIVLQGLKKDKEAETSLVLDKEYNEGIKSLGGI